jgi:hypothetical protein
MTVTSTTRPASPHPSSDLYVVATHKVRDRSAGAPHSWLPYGTEHAWRPGTRRTLCGEWISGWTVFWERRFSARPAAACPRCVEQTLPEESRRRLDRMSV